MITSGHERECRRERQVLAPDVDEDHVADELGRGDQAGAM